MVKFLGMALVYCPGLGECDLIELCMQVLVR